jgi:hypothetical protein
MKLTPKTLTAKENALFDTLARTADFRKRLYRDGVPTPEAYLAQRIRVLFVFREPNMRGSPYALDMRDEVHDDWFRPIGRDGTRQARSPKSWWNGKAGMFAHAVAAALDGEPANIAFDRFSQGGWNHEVVNRYAYIQVKKIGGGGTSNVAKICAHASKYAGVLKEQVELYRPHLVLGCGVGKDSPAQLLAVHVLSDGGERVTSQTQAKWWEFSAAARPRAMVQLWHPARRGSRWTLYEDVWSSVQEVASKMGLRGRR